MTTLEQRLKHSIAQRDSNLTRYRLKPRGTPWNQPGVVDFVSSDYLGFAQSQTLRDLVTVLQCLQATAPNEILGGGGSRLAVNPTAHSELEVRWARFFRSPAALLFNSG
jgi:8-amino-7-oxononanoate synthase